MAAPPGTVALHLGAHKTATTHLQSTFEGSAKILAANQIGFAGPRDLRGPGRTLFDRFPGRHPTPQASTRPVAEELTELAKGARHLVLSEENYLGPTFPKPSQAGSPLYRRGADRVERITALFDPIPVTLFLSIRDPASFLVSLYAQALLGSKHLTFGAFLGEIEPIDLSWLELLSRLARVAGLAGIVVWRFEDYGSLQPQIFDRLLGAPLFSKLAPLKRRANEGLSAAAVAKVLHGAEAGETGALAAAARDAFPVGQKFSKHAPFSEADLKASARIYDLEVAEIARLPNVELLRQNSL